MRIKKSGRDLSKMEFTDEKAKDAAKATHKMPDLKAKARGGVPVVFKIVSTRDGFGNGLSRQTRLNCRLDVDWSLPWNLT